MSLKLFSVETKLAEIEQIIRQENRRFGSGSHRVRVLCAVASDLRARLPNAPGTASAAIRRRLEAALKDIGPNGYPLGAVVGIGEELINRWPVVEQALENFTEEKRDEHSLPR